MGNGEGDLGLATRRGGDVLVDHVDVHVGLGQGLEDARGRTGFVADADQGDHRIGGRVGDGGDEGFSMFSPSETTTVPGPSSKDERQWMRTS